MTAYDLDARFATGADPSLLTGVQAIARFFAEQHALDARRGLDTAFFVSGYQGSPLGGVDRMLAGMPEVLHENNIHFQPGLNEELAATSVWGSQAELPGGTRTHDGVIGVWYGKGPGVDRATDALRHMAMYGVHPTGGVVLLVGDDPAAKSSTVPAVSERSLAALGIPVLIPRNASEVVTFGLHAVALSRVCGTPVAVKIVADVADGAWVVDDSVSATEPVVPDVEWDERPWHYRQSPPMVGSASILAVEAEFVGPRVAAIHAYAAANDLNVTTLAPDRASLGLVATGPASDSLRQALIDLGATDDDLEQAGVRILQVGLVHPLTPSVIEDFAEGLEEIVVVEDKTSFLEAQVRDLLYGRPQAPRVLGKKDSEGLALIPADGELTPGRLREPLRRVLGARMSFTPPPPSRQPLPLLPISRAPYFCSGCPHNRSTAVPDGSLAAGGIGCHTLVTMSKRADSAVVGFTQMGGEGAQWIGQAPFTSTSHIFQNLGDGTFFHSGQLAIQACVAAGVNVTYKLLHNEVVAMTGAQDAEGALSVAAITHKLSAEGVARTIVVADEPERHSARAMAPGVVVWQRDRLDEAQRILRETPGVTVLIYDQHCAADARRQRKRGTLPARPTRIVINEDVCEGCGDCGVKSNCLSVQPVATEFGDKTRIEQTSCNTDYSCLEGDCPAFMTVEVDESAPRSRRELPTPPTVAAPDSLQPGSLVPQSTQSILLTGVGGTGIVTVNQVLATAALRAGYAVDALDQIGLSQKAGPVIAHLRFATSDLDPSNRVTPGAADAILAFDLLTAAEGANLAYGDPERTVAVVSTSVTPTGHEVYNRSLAQSDAESLVHRVRTAVASVHQIDMLAAAAVLFGGTTAANFLLVGAAVQAGALRLPPEAIEEAIGINGVAVALNVAAFRWGRVAIADPAAFAVATSARGAGGIPDPVAAQRMSGGLRLPALEAASFAGETRRIATIRAIDLVGFQDQACATSYVQVLDQVWQAERQVTDDTRLSETVARYLYKLTAYKDEYEVARLLTRERSAAFAGAAVPDGQRLTYRLHPPMVRALGRRQKMAFGPATHQGLKALVPLKRLRGTPFDPFGRAHVRRIERELLRHYRETLHTLIQRLDAETYEQAVAFAALPDLVRGYEDVKLRNVQRYAAQVAALGLDVPDVLAAR